MNISFNRVGYFLSFYVHPSDIVHGYYCGHTCSMTYPSMHYGVTHKLTPPQIKTTRNLLLEGVIFGSISPLALTKYHDGNHIHNSCKTPTLTKVYL